MTAVWQEDKTDALPDHTTSRGVSFAAIESSLDAIKKETKGNREAFAITLDTQRLP